MTIIMFILASVFIAGVLISVIKASFGDIKTLNEGSTLEKMELLQVGVSQMSYKSSVSKLIVTKKRSSYITAVIGIVIVALLICIASYKLILVYLGIH